MRLLDPFAERELGRTILAELESEVQQELQVLVEDFTLPLVASPGLVELDQRGALFAFGAEATKEAEDESQGRTVVTNDFAAELLYIMRSAGDMLGD